MRLVETAHRWRWLALALGLTLLLPASLARAQQRATASDADIKRLLGLPADYKNKEAFTRIKDGVDAFLRGQISTAEDKFNDARDKDKSLPPGRVQMAFLWVAAQRADQARRELELAAIDDPDNSDVYLVLGSLDLREGRLTDAQLEFRAALDAHEKLKLDPASEENRSFMRKLYAGMTQVAEQRQKWDQAKTLAQIWLANAEPEKGKQHTTQEQKDMQAVAEVSLARAEFFLDDTEAAEKALEKAAELNKDVPNAKTQMGSLATQQAAIKGNGDRTNEDYQKWMKQAQKYFEEGVATATGDEAKARAEGAYAQWLVQDNRIQEAEEHAQKALQLDPKSDAYKRVVAVLDLHRHNYKEAEKLFREMYQKSPSDLFASNNLALALVGEASSLPESSQERTDQLRMAEELAVVNARGNPKSGDVLGTLAWVYLNQNRVNEASQILEGILQSVRQQGGGVTPDIAYFSAKAAARNGRLTEAANMLAQAVNSGTPFMYHDEAKAWLDQLVGQGVKVSSPPETRTTETSEKPAASGASNKAPSTPPARNPAPQPK